MKMRWAGMMSVALLGLERAALADEGVPLPAAEPKVVDSAVSAAPAPPTPNAAADLRRMHETLSILASGYDGYRISSAIAGLAIGGVAIPTGIVMLNRVPANSGATQSLGGAIVLGAGIGAVVGGGLNLAIGVNPNTKLLDGFEHRMRSGSTPEANVAETEILWRQTAEETRAARKIAGGLGLGIGSVAMGVGMYFALAPKMSSLGRSEQDGYAALLMTAGIATVIGSLQVFFIQSSLETSWQGYRGGKGLAKSPRMTPQVGVAPMPGGGLLSLSSRF